jgi:hypothetical protein
MAVSKSAQAATAGALLGGAIIWALEEYVFTNGAPGVLRDLIDWLAPLIAAAIGAWLGYRYENKKTGGAPPPAGPAGPTPIP